MTDILSSLPLQAGALAVVIMAAIYLYIKSSYSYWTKLGVPISNPIVPFGDFFEQVIKNTSFQSKVRTLYQTSEGYRFVGLYGLGKRILLVRDVDLIRDILVKDFIHFHDRGINVSEKGNPLDQNLFFLTGANWRNLRVKMTPTFTSGKMKMMFGTLVECGKELRDVLLEAARKGETTEIKDILARYATDIIASCAFGIQCNCLKNPNAEFRKWGRKITALSLRVRFFRFLNLVMPSLIRRFGVSMTPTDVTNYFTKMVTETVEYREKSGVKRNDFMQLMVQLKNKTLIPGDEDAVLQDGLASKVEAEDNKGLEVTNDVIAAQAFVFFAAGFETSSTTMTYCLYELALNPDIQERVRNEIDSVLEKHGGNITYDSIVEMEYLDMVVSETLRKYPPVQLLFRDCTNAYRIPGTDVTLQKGIQVFIPVMALHYDPKYYPDPERFDPERFGDNEKKNRPQYTYLPFGEGPRICIGMRFGLLQTKVGLISLLSSYEVRVSEKTPIPLVFDPSTLILSPKGEIYLKIVERSDSQ